MVFVIIPAIAIIFIKPFTDIDPIILVNSNIAAIEEGMEVSFEQQSVIDRVRSLGSIWFNMCCLENRQRFFTRNRTAPLVGIRDNHSESSLAQPVLRQGFSVPFTGSGEINGRMQTLLDCQEEPHAILVFCIIAFPLDDTPAEVLRRRDPILFIKVKNISEDDTADLRILYDDIVPGTVFFNRIIQVLEGCRPVLFTEGFPGEVCWEQRIFDKIASADNIVLRSMQLKQKKIVFLQSLKGLTSGLPEI